MHKLPRCGFISSAVLLSPKKTFHYREKLQKKLIQLIQIKLKLQP